MNIVIRVQARQAQAALRATRSAMKDLDGAQVSGARSTNMLSASMAAGASHMTRMGNRLQWTGRQLTYNWTLPIVAAGAAMTKWQLDNEKAMTRVQKVYGDLDLQKALGTQGIQNEIESLRKSFVALSNQFGVTQSDVINIAADWAAAGASGLALAKSTELTLKAMVLGEMDYEKATKSLISIQAQYQLTSDGLAKTLSQLNAVENQTGTSLNDLIEAFTRTAGVARSAGVTTGELAAMIAAIVPAAGSAANGGNALKTIISRLLAPTKDVVDTLGKMNINVADSGWQSKTASERLAILSKKYMELSGAQKIVVSSYVASRWQLNKFDILMRAMSSDNSYYARALEVSADSTKYFQISNQELAKVLDSQPQRLKQIGVILQNVGANVITPFIPMLVGFGNEIRKLGEWFGSLDPRIQKTIGYVLLFIAVIGPIAKYVGSIGTLLGTMGSAFVIFGGGVLRAAGALRVLLFLPFTGAAKGVAALIGTVGSLIARFGGLTAIWTAVTTQIVGRLMGVKMIFGAVFSYFIRTCWMLPTSLASMWAGVVAGANAAAYGMAAAFKKVPLLILASLKRLPMLLLGFLISPWGIALTAVISLVIVFRKQLGVVFSRIGDALLAPWNAAMGGLGNTAGFFAKFIQFIKNVFWSLPVEVQHAMMAVVRVVQQAALAVYHLFQYLNPFAHHSPSLVENVTKGMAVVVGQFNTLGKIKSPIDSAYANIKKLKDLTANFMASQSAKERKGQIDNLAKVAPRAVAVFKALSREAAQLQKQLDRMAGPIAAQQQVVDGLSNKLDELNFQLDQQQKILDRLQDSADGYSQKIEDAKSAMADFASAPLQGMGKLNEAIFQNEQAQKALQLQMLKIKQAGGGYDDLAGKIAALNGQMEILQADKTTARAGGAGSEITKFYDDQLTGIQKQKDAIGEQADEYAKLSKQLDELNDKSQELDLTKSLNFDGLQHQLELLANTQKEITFDQAVQGIKNAQEQIAHYQPLLDAVNGQIKDQQAIVDQLAAIIRPIQDEYDIQNHKLEVMKAAYDQVNQVAQDISQAMSDISSKADTAASKAAGVGKGLGKGKGGLGKGQSAAADAFDNAAAGGFNTPGGGGAGPSREGGNVDQSKLIDEYTKQLSDQTGKMWDNIDILGPLKKKWDGVKTWASTEIAPAFKPIKDYVGSLFEGVDWLAPFKKGSGIGDFIASIGTEFKKIPGYAKQAWDFLQTLFGDDFIKLFKDTKDAIVGAFRDVAPQIKPLFETLKGLIPIVKTTLVVAFGILATAVKLVVRLLARILPPIISLVGNILKNLVRIIRGVVKIIVGLFTGDFKQVASGLSDIFKSAVDIVWNAMKAVVQIIAGALDAVFNTVFSMGAAIFGKDSAWGKAFLGARDIVSQAFDETIQIVTNFFNSIGAWVGKVYDSVVGWFAKMYDEIIGHSIIPDLINGIVEWFKGLPGKLATWVQSMYDRVTGKFNEMWNWVKDKFGVWWGGLKYLFTHPLESARIVIHAIQDKIRGIFSDLWEWFSNTWIGKKWNTLKDKLLKPMKEAKDYLKDILTGKKSIKEVFEDAVHLIGQAWDKLKEKAKSPIKFIVNTVMNDGFIKAFNDFGSHLPGKPSIPNIHLPKGFAEGGSTGPGSKYKPAGIVHADEHVFTKREVAMTPGGHKTLEKVRESIRSGHWSTSHSRDFDGGDKPAAAFARLKGYAEGGAVNRYQRALSWAKGERGKPYVFGSAGPGGYDCSGFMAAIQNVIEGKSIHHRRYSTPAFSGAHANGFTRNKKAAFMVGVNPAPGKSGHMAGTLMGTNVESSGGVGVRVGGGARGYNNSMFSWRGGLTSGPDPADQYNGFFDKIKKKFKDLMGRFSGDGDVLTKMVNAAGKELPSKILDMGKQWIKDAIKNFLHSIGLNARGTGGSKSGLSWVGEQGPELMNLKAGSRILSNGRSTSRLATGVESTVTRALTSGMSSAMKPIEQATVTAVTRAVANAERRVASRTDSQPREANSMTNTRTVVIQNAEFPNVKDGNDAKDFIENLVLVTSGVGGNS